MSPRRSLVAMLLLVTIPVVAGCGVGTGSETEQERTTPYAAGGNAGSVAVRSARIVVAEGVPPSASPSPGGGSSGVPSAPQAYLIASIVNRGHASDSLTNATVAGGAVQPVGGDVTGLTLPPSQLIQFGDPELGFTGTALGVGALATPLVPGTTTTVTFTFRTAGTVSIDVPIITPSDVGSTASAAPVTG